jgi:hypothetical protein
MADRFFICPDGARLSESQTSGWTACYGSPNNGDTSNSRWIEPTHDELLEILSIDIDAPSPPDMQDFQIVLDLLQSISSFDPAMVSLYIGMYLVTFIVGFSAASVIRMMKKA